MKRSLETINYKGSLKKPGLPLLKRKNKRCLLLEGRKKAGWQKLQGASWWHRASSPPLLPISPVARSCRARTKEQLLEDSEEQAVEGLLKKEARTPSTAELAVSLPDFSSSSLHRLVQDVGAAAEGLSTVANSSSSFPGGESKRGGPGN